MKTTSIQPPAGGKHTTFSARGRGHDGNITEPSSAQPLYPHCFHYCPAAVGDDHGLSSNRYYKKEEMVYDFPAPAYPPHCSDSSITPTFFPASSLSRLNSSSSQHIIHDEAGAGVGRWSAAALSHSIYSPFTSAPPSSSSSFNSSPSTESDRAHSTQHYSRRGKGASSRSLAQSSAHHQKTAMSGGQVAMPSKSTTSSCGGGCVRPSQPPPPPPPPAPPLHRPETTMPDSLRSVFLLAITDAPLKALGHPQFPNSSDENGPDLRVGSRVKLRVGGVKSREGQKAWATPAITSDSLATDRRGSIAPGSAGPSKQPTPPRLGGPHQGGSNKVTPMMPAMGGGGGGITTLGAVHPMHHISTGGAGERSVKSGKAPEKKAAGKKGGKPKLRKEDIGNPTEFKHLAHVGWNANEGSDVQVMEGEPMDATVRELLQAAGHNPDKMKKGDLKFAYQWLDEIGFDPKQPLPAPAQGGPPPGFEAVPGVTLRPATTGGIGRATPAACHMGGGGARAVPPPRPPPMATGPPLGRPLPQPPSQHVTVVAAPPVQPHYYIQDGHHPAPTVPPAAPTNATMKRPPPPAPPSQPPTVNGGGGVGNLAPMAAASSVPPPPPPPPPQLLMSGAGGSAPPPPPPPGQEMKPALGGGGGASRPPPPQQAPSANLLQQIQAGAKLRRVEVDPGRAPVPTNPPTSRDQMMKQIQQGAQLKHVDPTEVEENRKSGTGLQSFDGIAGALARALEERRRNMMQGDDTDDDDSDNGGANNDSEWEDE